MTSECDKEPEELTFERSPTDGARDVSSPLLGAIPNPYIYALNDEGGKATLAFFGRYLLAAAAGAASVWLNFRAFRSFTGSTGLSSISCLQPATAPQSATTPSYTLNTILCSSIEGENTSNGSQLFHRSANCNLHGYNATSFFLNSTKEIYFFNLRFAARSPYDISVSPEMVTIDCLLNSSNFDPRDNINGIKGYDACGLLPWVELDSDAMGTFLASPFLVWFLSTILSLIYEIALLVTIYRKRYRREDAGELSLMVQEWESSSKSIPTLTAALRSLSSTRVLLPLASFSVFPSCRDFSTLQGNLFVIFVVSIGWMIVPLMFVAFLIKCITCGLSGRSTEGGLGETHTGQQKSMAVVAAILSGALYVSYLIGDIEYVTSFFTVNSVENIEKISASLDRPNLARIVLVFSATTLFVWDSAENLQTLMRCSKKVST
eukprot:gb/GECG01014073.1/.p1 GENE.gb/GECG01014073.1/~~gb/GECG01014073.1/.p1  ORF type:complete len:434 (+),score=26.42 gb/GECG01014073.1/:1-1302(+)